MHSFFRFASYEAPDHAAQIERIAGHPGQKFDRALVPFLSRAEVEALLAAPIRTLGPGVAIRADAAGGADGASVVGIDQPAPDDVNLGTGSHVRVIGKGRRSAAPMSKGTRTVMAAWLRRTARSPDQPVFPNARGGPLSSHGVPCLLAKRSNRQPELPVAQAQAGVPARAAAYDSDGPAAGRRGAVGDRAVARACVD